MKRKFFKVLSLVLVSMLVFAAVSVSAAVAVVELRADKGIVEPGDQVTVSVVMNEAVAVEDVTTVLQFELNYDAESVTYVSHKLGSNYSFVDVVVSGKSPVIKAYWIYLMDLGIDFDAEMDEEALAEMLAAAEDEIKNPEAHVRELPAGTVLSVTFAVNDAVTATELVSSLSNSFTLSAEGDVTNTFDSVITVQVCTGHTDGDDDGNCDKCGTTLTMLGDVDGNGKINARDALAILRYAAGRVQEDELVMSAADVDFNGKVNARDALAILRYAAGRITEFT